jgi:hypothetical protein
MIVAYIAWPPDNNTYMWADPKTRGNPPPGIICPTCGMRTDWNVINPNYRPPRSYYDLSRAYDGDILVSPRLRQYLEEQQVPGLCFVQIPASRRYFILQCTDVLRLVRPATLHLEEYCAACKQYKSVWGTQPETARFEGVNAPIRSGMYFTDLRVGYFPQMGPLLIVGVDTWRGMAAQGFKGLGNGKPIVN